MGNAAFPALSPPEMNRFFCVPRLMGQRGVASSLLQKWREKSMYLEKKL